MPIKGDSWFDEDGKLDFEEIQEDTSWAADMAGVAQRRTTNKLLKQQQKEREAARRSYQALKDCPYCGAKLPKVGVEICMHCRKELAWVERTPCKPGTEGQVRKQLKKSEAIRVQRLRAEKQRELERKEKFQEELAGNVFGWVVALLIYGLGLPFALCLTVYAIVWLVQLL